MSFQMLQDIPIMDSQLTLTDAVDATHRIVIHPDGFWLKYPNQIQIVLAAELTGGTTSTISKVYIGRSAADAAGNPYDFLNADTITEVTFGGSSGVTLSAGAETFSDTIDFELHPTQTHVLSIHTSNVVGNTVQYDATTFAGSYSSYTRRGGNYSDLVALGTPDISTAGRAYFIKAFYENNDLNIDATLPALLSNRADRVTDATLPVPTLSAVGGPATQLSSLLPALELSIQICTLLWTEVPQPLPCMSMDASIGDRLNVDGDLLHLTLEASMAAQSAGKLPTMELVSTLLMGSTGRVLEKLSFPTLSVLPGSSLSPQNMPVLALEIELSSPKTASLDTDLTFLSILATGGREGVGVVDSVLFVPELSASMGAKQGHLSTEIFSLELAATGGPAFGVDTYLPALTISATGYDATVGVSAILFALDLLATAGEKQAYLDAAISALTISATGGVPAAVDAQLPALSVSAAGHAADIGVSSDLFSLALTATAGEKQGYLDAAISALTISATGGLATIVDAQLPLLTISATGHAADIGVSADLFSLALTATAGEKQGHLDTSLSAFTVSATGGQAAYLSQDLLNLELLASGHGMDAGLNASLFALSIAATGTDRGTTLVRDLFALSLSATASGMQSALAVSLPWMSISATMISGIGSVLDADVSIPALSASMLETPLMSLDADLGTLYMGAQVSAGDDPTLPGGKITNRTYWSTTVLRHSRW